MNFRYFIFLVYSGFLIPSLHAQMAVTLPLIGDYLLASDGVTSVTNNTDSGFRVGSSSGGGRNVVLVFQLPDLGAVPAPFRAASLQIRLADKDTNGSANLDFNTDVYAFGPVVNLPEADGDASPIAHFEGPLHPTVPRIIDNLLQPDSPVNEPITGSGTLVNFLNAVYDSGNGAGEVFVLQLVPDRVTNAESISYDLLGQESQDFDQDSLLFVTLSDALLPPGAPATGDMRFFAPSEPSWAPDSDQNGLIDAFETVLGLNPEVAEARDLDPLTLRSAIGDTLYLDYSRRSPVDGRSLPQVEVSTDLQEWTRNGVNQTHQVGPVSDQREPVTATYTSDEPAVFARLRLADNRTLEELTFPAVRDLWARTLRYVMENTTSLRNRGTGPFAGDYEVISRTLWTLGAWFIHGDRPNTLSIDGATIDLQEFVVNALRNGSDTSVSGSWPRGGTGKSQPTVESANIAFVAWALATGHARSDDPTSQPWEDLSSVDQGDIFNWLDLTDNQVPGNGEVQGYFDNNWNLFLVLNYGARRELAAMGYSAFDDYNEAAIGEAMRRIQEFHRGDGWYSDDLPNAEFDGYVPWTLIPHQLFYFIMSADQTEAETVIPGTSGRGREAILEDISSYLASQPWFFDGDGGHPEWGRSSTYKFSRLMSLVLAYVIDRHHAQDWGLEFKVLPDAIELGQLRRLIRLHLNHYLSLEMIDPDTHRIHPGQTRSSGPEIIENYSTPGSTYWTQCLFATLFLLEDNDPLWSTKEVSLPAERNHFLYWLQTPGFLLHHSNQTGLMELINLRNDKIPLWRDYERKYAKFVYDSRIGYCTRSGPDYDQSLELNGETREVIDEGDFFIPEGVTNNGVGRTVCQIDGWRVSTLIFLKGGAQIRVHRVTEAGSGMSDFSLKEGGYAFGYDESETPVTLQGSNWRYIEGSKGSAFIQTLAGYTETGVETGQTHHSRSARFQIGVGQADNATPNSIFAFMSRGSRGPQDPAALAGWVTDLETSSLGARITFADGSQLAAPFLE
jgi:hypothetical protein